MLFPRKMRIPYEMDLRPMKRGLVREIALAKSNSYLNGLECGVRKRDDLTTEEREDYQEQIYKRRLEIS